MHTVHLDKERNTEEKRATREGGCNTKKKLEDEDLDTKCGLRYWGERCPMMADGPAQKVLEKRADTNREPIKGTGVK